MSQPNGLAAAEGARSSLLVAEVVDVDWNLERVEVDLTALGLGVRVLNDRGQDGDQAVDDDRWTTTLTVLDTTAGVFSAPVTVVDAFTSTTYDNATVQIDNPAPRIISIDLVPDRVQRGGAVIVEANVVDQHGVASVGVDLSGLSGGALVPLTQVSGTTTWSGAFTPLGRATRLDDAAVGGRGRRRRVGGGHTHRPRWRVRRIGRSFPRTCRC